VWSSNNKPRIQTEKFKLSVPSTSEKVRFGLILETHLHFPIPWGTRLLLYWILQWWHITRRNHLIKSVTWPEISHVWFSSHWYDAGDFWYRKQSWNPHDVSGFWTHPIPLVRNFKSLRWSDSGCTLLFRTCAMMNCDTLYNKCQSSQYSSIPNQQSNVSFASTFLLQTGLNISLF